MGVKEWFGPSKDEIWRQLSDAIGASYVDGGSFKSARVEASHRDWVVTLDSFVVPAGKVFIPCTRMRAAFRNPGGFRFTVYRMDAFSGIAKAARRAGGDGRRRERTGERQAALTAPDAPPRPHTSACASRPATCAITIASAWRRTPNEPSSTDVARVGSSDSASHSGGRPTFGCAAAQR